MATMIGEAYANDTLEGTLEHLLSLVKARNRHTQKDADMKPTPSNDTIASMLSESNMHSSLAISDPSPTDTSRLELNHVENPATGDESTSDIPPTTNPSLSMDMQAMPEAPASVVTQQTNYEISSGDKSTSDIPPTTNPSLSMDMQAMSEAPASVVTQQTNYEISSGKTKRHSWPISFKQEVIRWIQTEGRGRPSLADKHFADKQQHVPSSCIRKWWQNRDRILKGDEVRTRIPGGGRKPKLMAVEEHILVSIIRQRQKTGTVSKEWVATAANQLFQDKHFVSSSNWITRFMQRHNLAVGRKKRKTTP